MIQFGTTQGGRSKRILHSTLYMPEPRYTTTTEGGNPGPLKIHQTAQSKSPDRGAPARVGSVRFRINNSSRKRLKKTGGPGAGGCLPRGVRQLSILLNQTLKEFEVVQGLAATDGMTTKAS